MPEKETSYILSPGLQGAVEVALTLGMPLLLTGEPGTGKTQLAHFLAKDYAPLKGKISPDIQVFNTKTTSAARDVLYSYDALGHFRASSIKGQESSELNPMKFISFEALGKAILESDERRQVVLVDEIDKAPRDFPNDLLHEFDKFNFAVKEASPAQLQAAFPDKSNIDEQGFISVAKPENKPILILTSNSEKNLPAPFLRRCVFYHIEFPDRETLLHILDAKGGLGEEFQQRVLEDALAHFKDIRENLGVKKKPATAELLSWLHIIEQERIDLKKVLQERHEKADDPDLRKQKERLFKSYSLLAKHKDDLQAMRRFLGLNDYK